MSATTNEQIETGISNGLAGDKSDAWTRPSQTGVLHARYYMYDPYKHTHIGAEHNSAVRD